MVANEDPKDAAEVGENSAEVLKVYYYYENITVLHLESDEVSKMTNLIVTENEDLLDEQAN